jgi:hypothetical protein
MDSETVDRTDMSIRALVELLAAESCVSLFAAYNVHLEPVASPALPNEEAVMTGIIGFSGPGIWGMCLLACSRAPVSASNPAGGSARDWLAELVNQLAGRLKSRLLQHGAPVYITTPIVLRAARVEPMPQGGLKPRLFAAPEGNVELWVEIEIAPDFTLAPEAAEATVDEGDAILF